MDKKDTSKNFEDCMKQLTIYRRQKIDSGESIKNGCYYLEDLKAFYKIVYSKLREVKKNGI
jgi:hypothetical protein